MAGPQRGSRDEACARGCVGAPVRRHGSAVLVQGPMLNIDFDINVDVHRCAFAFAACDDSCGLTKWLL